MIKKVTYTFLNIFLFDNKWRIKLLNVISSRITLFSFVGVRLSLPDCLPVVRKSMTDLMLRFLLFFYLPGIVSLVEQYAWGQSIVTRRCIPIPESSAFPRPTGKIKRWRIPFVGWICIRMVAKGGRSNLFSSWWASPGSRFALPASPLCSLLRELDLNGLHVSSF